MSYGILSFLDDVAALAKMASASLDDIATQSMQAGSQSLGLVIDDAAVTPKYVTDISPARELPAIFKIARWSLFNKLIIILPLTLLLSALLPGIITPLLMAGGLFLAFEGAEKILEVLGLHAHHDTSQTQGTKQSAAELEKTTVKGAIRTDFILSCEIMVMTLSSVAEETLVTQLGVLAAIAVIFTLGVYGVVALIVRTDDFGLRLAKNNPGSLSGRFGKGLVKHVPTFLKALTAVGTAAMLWVGGSLIIHGLAHYHIELPEHLIHEAAVGAGHILPAASGAIEWGVTAAFSGILALLSGSVIAGLMSLLPKKSH